MSRYIDADAFEYQLKEIEAITAMVDKELGEDEGVGKISIPMFTIRNIMKRCAPIDIVRCKECKHRVVEEQSWGEYNGYCDLWCDGIGYWASVNADDFCSYGEREGE